MCIIMGFVYGMFALMTGVIGGSTLIAVSQGSLFYTITGLAVIGGSCGLTVLCIRNGFEDQKRNRS